MPGVSRLVGAILYPVAGRMTRCSEPARHNTHFSTEHQTERSQVPGGEEAEFLCDNYQELWKQVQAAIVWPRYSHNTAMPALGSSHLTWKSKCGKWSVRYPAEQYGPRQCLTHLQPGVPTVPPPKAASPVINLPRLPYDKTSQGNQTTDEARRDVWPTGGPSFIHNLCNFIQRTMWLFKVL